MIEFLVTHTEYLTEDGRTKTLLYGRHPSRPEHRHRVEVSGFDPRFWVPLSEVEGRLHDYLGRDGIIRIETDTGRRGFATGEPLAAVYVGEPRQMRGAASSFTRSYGADTAFVNRFRVETGLFAWVRVPGPQCEWHEVEPIEQPADLDDPAPRVIAFDIETDDRGAFPRPGEKPILSIVAHDSIEGTFIGFMDGGRRPVASLFPDGKPAEVDELYVEPDERRMLIRFGSWVAARDPDLITAWNGDSFDFPYIVERMKLVGASPARLSPEGAAYLKGDGEAVVRGRVLYDLLEAYKSNSRGELASYRLNAVAEAELGAEKLHHDETIYEMWRENPSKLIAYNAIDVRLMVEIDATAGVIAFRDSLRKQVGVDFTFTKNANQFPTMNVRRKLLERGEVGPTGEYADNAGYEGAHVFRPSTGVFRNVVGVDVNSLYPWTMFSLNTSPEVRVDDRVDPEAVIFDEETGHGYADIDGETVPVSVAPNGVVFRRDRVGLFPSLIEDAIALKSEYKQLKKEASRRGDAAAEDYYGIKYDVAKAIVNSYYGIVGWGKFFLYDERTAEAITLAGQAVIKETSRFIREETVAIVTYGDTDSQYIRFPEEWDQRRCVSEAFSICRELEEWVYPDLAASMGIPRAECKWRIGPEMYGTFFQWGSKKLYAYLPRWKEGMEPDAVIADPAPVVKGSKSKRSDAAALTARTEKAVLDAILNDRLDDVPRIVYEAGRRIDPDEPAWDEIGIPGSIKKPLHEYANQVQPRAAGYSNAILGTNFGAGSKPKRVYLRPTYFDEVGGEIDVIAFDDAEDLDPIRGRLHIDVQRMTTTLIVNPLRPILDAVGIDADVALSGAAQSSLDAFL